MVKRSVKQAVVVIGIVAVAAAARRLVGSRSPSGRTIQAPAIGGDTWPPVPVNPDRRP